MCDENNRRKNNCRVKTFVVKGKAVLKDWLDLLRSTIRWAWAHSENLQWLVLRNGGDDFLHSRFIDSIYIVERSGSVITKR